MSFKTFLMKQEETKQDDAGLSQLIQQSILKRHHTTNNTGDKLC